MLKTILLLMGIATLSFSAQQVPDSNLIYTWGYASLINEILQAIRGVVSESGMLFKTALLLGFMLIFIRKAFDSRSNPFFELGKLSVVSLLMWHLFLHAPNDSKHKYMIFDETTSESYVVSEIPIGIGHIFSLTSRIERGILKGMEKHYSTPQSLSMSNSGIGFSLNSMMALPKIRADKIDPNFQTNMDNFVAVCIHYNTLDNPSLLQQITTSQNLKTTLLDNFNSFPYSNLLVNYSQSNGNNATTTSLITCQELAKNLSQSLSAGNGIATKAEALHQAYLGQKNNGIYRDKMDAIANLYHAQWQGARETLQQTMLIFSYRDGIKNMEKMYGLQEGQLASASAVAHYNFFNQMNAQGVMAQTYLPIAKAYLTALIIGISWIIAIFTVMFGDFRYIKMFFVLLLWLVLWTPILSIINYFNDLILGDIFAELQKNGTGFSISSNTDLFVKIQEQTSFMNYLVMLTPMLAFAIAKASEMGFVTVASSLSTSLAGGSRSAGTFATQQATSTSNSIAVGDSTYTRINGLEVIATTSWRDGNAFNVSTTLGNSRNDTIKLAEGDANVSISSDGKIHSSHIGDITKTNMLQGTQSRMDMAQRNLSKSISSMSGDTINSVMNDTNASGLSSNHQFNKNLLTNFRDSINKSDSFTETEKNNIDLALKVDAGVGFKVLGSGIGVNGGLKAAQDYSNQLAKDTNIGKSKEIAEAFQKAYVLTAMQNESITASLSNSKTLSSNDEFRDAMSNAQQYSTAKSQMELLSTNGTNQLVEQMAYQIAGGEKAFMQGTQDQKVTWVQSAISGLQASQISQNQTINDIKDNNVSLSSQSDILSNHSTNSKNVYNAFDKFHQQVHKVQGKVNNSSELIKDNININQQNLNAKSPAAITKGITNFANSIGESDVIKKSIDTFAKQ